MLKKKIMNYKLLYLLSVLIIIILAELKNFKIFALDGNSIYIGISYLIPNT